MQFPDYHHLENLRLLLRYRAYGVNGNLPILAIEAIEASLKNW